MRISFSAIYKQAQPLVSFPPGVLNMDPFMARPHSKDKEVVVVVVVVVGATGTGKSKLSIDLATRFPAEIANSDEVQVYKGLDIATNKVTDEERRGVPHHLLGVVDPNVEFTDTDFGHHASLAVESIVRRDRLPIVAGGSDSYIKALVSDEIEFLSRYDCCFLWVDVSLPVLNSFVSERVDRMVEIGLVDKIGGIFDPNADHISGIRRAIGVPKALMLKEAIEKIKSNTCKLACCNLEDILRLQNQLEWSMHCLDATEAFLKGGNSHGNNIWEKSVAGPSTQLLTNSSTKKVLEQSSPPNFHFYGYNGCSRATIAHVLITAVATATLTKS